MPETVADNSRTVPGRSCGSCSLCCKLPPFEEPGFKKPANEWCPHCAPGKGGCQIFETRPQTCRDFWCLWMLVPELDDRWRPTVAKMFLIVDRTDTRISVYVDPAFASEWRQEPYYSELKRLSGRGQVVVFIKNRVIVVFPKKEIDLGILGPNDWVTIDEPTATHDGHATVSRSQ
jgi:hypothetical protein